MSTTRPQPSMPNSFRQVGITALHESARLHVTGQAHYTDDIPELQGTLHTALGLSSHAHARILAMNLDAVRQAEGVVAVLTCADIPADNNCGPVLKDDPILADGMVHYMGQPIFAVIAQSHEQARRAARLGSIEYEPLPPILGPRAAKQANTAVLPPMRLVQGDAAAALAQAPHRLQGQFECNGQEQFYLEGQIAYAIPNEGTLHVWSSTQHPSEMQTLVARALGIGVHKVLVECRRMGGGFGGKESQSALYACLSSIAASKLQRPVKLRLDREDDFMITGKRHGFYYEYDIAFDEQGRLLGADVDMTLNSGYSADLSGPVATRAICHFDNAYYLAHADLRALCGRTNQQSNTAFRGFGGPQGALLMEVVLDRIARYLKLDPLDVRKINFYGTEDRNLTPYDQVVSDNVIHELVAELEASSQYRERRAQIEDFNRHSPILKKGLALTPVKFGISFNMPSFNQAGALVHTYRDGTVLVNHGGTEMGQGLNTKVAQVVAHELGLPLSHIQVSATDTSKVANTSATAASTGTDLNGKAAQNAAAQIRARLQEMLSERFHVAPEQQVFANAQVQVGEQTFSFAEVVEMAYQARIQLWSDGFYATPGLHWDAQSMKGHPFFYFSYGAAVAEVVVDTLTGEHKLLRADLLHDVGQSINPDLDLGQVEGAFIQGMGWLTTEELVWTDQGRLSTNAPSTYKIPAVSDCPTQFHVALYKNRNRMDSIHRSKAVGEPPLLLAFCVFNAIVDAIASLSVERIEPELNAPATPEAVLMAITALRRRASHA